MATITTEQLRTVERGRSSRGNDPEPDTRQARPLGLVAFRTPVSGNAEHGFLTSFDEWAS
jgi:hypothetical protein